MENPFKKSVKVEDTEVDDKTLEAENSEEAKLEEESENQNEKSEESSNEQIEDSLQKKYDELNNQYIRLAADFDNFRKRTAQERESLLKYGAESTLKKLLEVLDNFERGEKANENVEDCDKLKESFNLVHKQLITKIQIVM